VFSDTASVNQSLKSRQSLSWSRNSPSLWNSKVHFCVRNTPPLDANLYHFNFAHILVTFTKSPFSTCWLNLSYSHDCYVLRMLHILLYDHLNNIRWRLGLQIMKNILCSFLRHVVFSLLHPNILIALTALFVHSNSVATVIMVTNYLKMEVETSLETSFMSNNNLNQWTMSSLTLA
jgi:hypothetical protein